MVGHQYEGMNGNWVLVGHLFHKGQIGAAVHLIIKASRAIVAALDDMLGASRQTRQW